MGLSLAGVRVSLAVALALSRLVAGLFFDVAATAPATYAALALLLAGVTLFACWLPARRVARSPRSSPSRESEGGMCGIPAKEAIHPLVCAWIVVGTVARRCVRRRSRNQRQEAVACAGAPK
jgi:hypothetical protein